MALNRSTIAALVGELEALGATEQVAPEAGRRSAGRPSPVVRADSAGPYVVAADVGVGRIRAARILLGGEVAARATARVPDRPDPVETAAVLAGLVEELTASAPPRATLVGVGVGVPGVIAKTGGVVRVAPNLDWRDVAFSELVAAHLDPSVPVLLDNDANLGALAEHLRGVGVGVDDLVYVIGLVGVGAGFIVGGAPLLGAGGYAGEIGHMRYRPDGEACHCGNRGCWETEVGAVAIARAIGAPAEQVSHLDEVLDDFDRAPEALREIGRHIGVGLASAVNLFNPRLVVLGGYLRSLYRLVGDDVDTALEERALRAPSQTVTVSLPGLGDDSVLLGAAEMAFAPVLADPVTVLSGADEVRA
ncbi:hypothetical protein LUZ63_020014 [Rhynchospora breviuscula]|uniref:ROK family protein n=1 Tax=Rhynchospora breviuscula TaxID=2022672 RepID=A0A9P9Z9E9_9POAL|nr:hypothetical protein LUZ63_020014 [Rhynchospora breviuscula]